MVTFEEDLQKAIAYHGHLCSGQILGVRMARIGLKYFNIKNPHAYKDLIAYVETDRCIADAICSVTGCKLGRRRLKWFDLGKMAVSFLDLQTNQAIRISSIADYQPNKNEDPVEFFNRYKDEDLFCVKKVTIDIHPEDLPGRPLNIVRCEKCGEQVFDNKQIHINGKFFCRNCINESYYKIV
jgi:formylmethanofuran dehydrogenase subunit E